MSNQARLHVLFNIIFCALLIVMSFTALFVPWTVRGISYDAHQNFWDVLWYPTLILAPIIGGLKAGTLTMTAKDTPSWRLWLLRLPVMVAVLVAGGYLGSHGFETVFGDAAWVTLPSFLWAYSIDLATFFLVVGSMMTARHFEGPVEVDA
ncbi:MAG TPA: hypothetical protein VHB93_01535 [Candidatus Paceibacterota bacterium]|nr:hypothetical protein [Candidatus Paceibacterota bacterium]